LDCGFRYASRQVDGRFYRDISHSARDKDDTYANCRAGFSRMANAGAYYDV